jgi:penicillin amidase
MPDATETGGRPVTTWVESMRGKARDALPPSEGRFTVGGLEHPVEVLWDRWGVPHIYAGSVHDLYFAQGYVVASQRLFQLELSLRLGSGCLAEVFSEMVLPLDRFIRTWGWNRAGARMAAAWDDPSRDLGRAFSDGARAWLERMPARPVEYEVLELDPWLPAGEEALAAAASAVVFMSFSLSANWDAELLRAEVADRFGWEAMTELFPDVPAESGFVYPGRDGGAHARRSAFDLLKAAPAFPKGQGSNNWVVSGARSATGMPLLANDPHILGQQPGVWFELHLSAPGVDVRGVALPFAPGVVIGHNNRIAWGETNVGGDTMDLYLERLNEDGSAALYEGAWEPVTIHHEEIAVRGSAEPEVLEVRETRHGPILDAYMIGSTPPEVIVGGITETYALRWVGLDETIAPATLFELNAASSFDEFRAALAGWHSPGQNFVYADIDGNIGYQCTGRHPIRRRGDGTMPVPGWTSEFEWTGYVPFDELPWSFNPDRGYVATANARPHDATYPWFLGVDFLPPFRARRVVELLTATGKHDVDSFARMHTDTVSLPAREIVPRLLSMEPATDRHKEALALLGAWDFDCAADSAAAALYQVWCCRLAEAILRPRLGHELYQHYFAKRQWTNAFQFQVLPTMLANPTARWFGEDGTDARDAVLRSSLDAALDELSATLGEDMAGWSWGAIHRVRLVGQLALIPDLAELFAGGVTPWGGDEQTVCQGMYEPGSSYDVTVIPSWRQVLDLGDLDRSMGTIPVGQSGNPESPHYRDLFPLWSTGRYHPLPFTRAAVEEATESRVELSPY